MRHKVIGFDARELWLDPDSQWPPARRASLLLRQDVLKPLSVDKFVWYSVFSEANYPHLWQSTSRQLRYTADEWNSVFSEDRKLTYSDTHPNDFRPRGLWTNLHHLRAYLHGSWGSIWKPCWLVAVAEMLGIDEEYETAYPILPDVVDSHWQLLGYDVASHELFTGLFNGALEGSDAPQLRASWNEHLNKYHLFKSAENAFQYIELADKRYSDHLPNYVYALYGIQVY